MFCWSGCCSVPLAWLRAVTNTNGLWVVLSSPEGLTRHRTGKWPREYKDNVCISYSRMQLLTSCITCITSWATTTSSQRIACTAAQGSFWGNAHLEHCLHKLQRGFWWPGWCCFLRFPSENTQQTEAPRYSLAQRRTGKWLLWAWPKLSSTYTTSISKSGFMFQQHVPIP